jgi:hypothetical protein
MVAHRFEGTRDFQPCTSSRRQAVYSTMEDGEYLDCVLLLLPPDLWHKYRLQQPLILHCWTLCWLSKKDQLSVRPGHESVLLLEINHLAIKGIRRKR